MKIRMTLWLVVSIVLCLAAFFFGKSQSRPVYDQKHLAIDIALLPMLRAGDITNLIEDTEASLDLETSRAMHNRALLHGRDRDVLDRTLERVARYRQHYPRHIDTNTNGNPGFLLDGSAAWISEQQQIDVFLSRFIITNEQPNTALDPTPTAP